MITRITDAPGVGNASAVERAILAAKGRRRRERELYAAAIVWAILARRARARLRAFGGRS